MAKTLAQLRTLTRALLSEPTAKYWSDSELNTYINDGSYLFCEQTDSLEDISTESSVQYQSDYSLPSDYTKIRRVEFVRSNSVYDLTPATISEIYTGVTRNSMSQPGMANIVGDKLRFDIRPSNAAETTTLNGTITAAVTSLTLADSSGFPREGRIKIDSEVIEYWNITSSYVVSPCTRGVEGTTAEAHTTAATVTLRDIYVYHFKRPAEMDSDTDTCELPVQFQNAAAHYAAYIGRMKSKDYDLANEQLAIFNNYVQQAIDWSKQKWQRRFTPK